MSNRVYLYRTNCDDYKRIASSRFNNDFSIISESNCILEGGNCIPLLWLMCFEEVDIYSVQVDIPEEEFNEQIPTLWAPLSKVRETYSRRVKNLKNFFPDKYFENIAKFKSLLEGPEEFLQADIFELSVMMMSPDQYSEMMKEDIKSIDPLVLERFKQVLDYSEIEFDKVSKKIKCYDDMFLCIAGSNLEWEWD